MRGGRRRGSSRRAAVASLGAVSPNASNAESSAAVVCKPSVVVPEHVFTRDDLKQAVAAVLGDDFPHLRRLWRIIDNSGIERRHLVRPLAEILQPAGFGARNAVYAEESRRLTETAARGALANAALAPEAIDLVITTSCTGIMIPAVCAHLIPALGLRPDTQRLPITELGCAAGTVALSRAREYLRCYPGRNVLIVAHELCSLTYQRADVSMQALVGAMLFGDGAAGVVVRGDQQPTDAAGGLRLDVNASFLFPDSTGYMGFDVRDSGLHLILDKGIPGAVERQIAPVLERFLAANGRAAGDVNFFCLHPGGRKILNEIARVFGLCPSRIRASYDCLAEVGNLSSASILVVLRNLMERYAPVAGATGLVLGFGPGFSAEMLLGTWVG